MRFPSIDWDRSSSTPSATDAGPGSGVFTLTNRATSRHPVAPIRVADPRRFRVARESRQGQHARDVPACLSRFPQFVHFPRMTDISADGRYGSGVVEGHGIGSGGTIWVRRQRDDVRPGHGHRAPLHLKGSSVSSSPNRADRGPGRRCGRRQPSRSRDQTSTMATGFDRHEDRPLDAGGGPSARRRHPSRGEALEASAGGASCGASVARVVA